MLENHQKIALEIAALKGFAHAFLIPILIMFTTNVMVEGNLGFVSALGYLFIPGTVYLKAKDKDMSKLVFFWTLKGLLIIFTIYILLVIS